MALGVRPTDEQLIQDKTDDERQVIHVFYCLKRFGRHAALAGAFLRTDLLMVLAIVGGITILAGLAPTPGCC